MTYIKLLDDMRLIVTWADEIYRGDNMSSAITFLFPLRVGTIDVAASTVFLNYIGVDGVPDTVILEPCEKMYDERHYQYAIPVTCKLSANPGEVTMWLQFYTGDAEHPTIKNSGECKLRILDSQDIDGCDHEDQNTVIYQFKDSIEKLGEALRYTPQELTPEQQAQARKNIGVTEELADNAVVTAKIVDKNVTKEKLSAEVQASLDKADSAATDATAKADKALEDAKAYVNSKVDGVDLSGIEANTEAINAIADALIQDIAPAVETAQEDIDALKAGKLGYSPQTLTSEQQAQVRSNIGIAQADMAQNDETKPDYVKNRLAYSTTEFKEILPEQTISAIEQQDIIYIYGMPFCDLSAGEKYTVTIDGVAYENVALDVSNIVGSENGAMIGIGNAGILTFMGADAVFDISDEPYFIVVSAQYGIGQMIYITANPTATISIVGKAETVHKLDPKYYERLAWTDGGFTVGDLVFEDTSDGYNAFSFEGVQCAVKYLPSNVVALEENKYYRVSIDGTEYVTQCYSKFADDTATKPLFNLGDFIDMHSGEPTNGSQYPFFISFADGSGVRAVCVAIKSPETTHTVIVHALEGTPEVIHKIDPKYYDRVAWLEDGYTAVLPQTTVDLFEFGEVSIDPFPLNVGETYCVELDGVRYEGLVCAEITEDGVDGDVRFVGNGSIFGVQAGDSTVPFIIVSMYQSGEATMSMLAAFADSTFETPLTGLHTVAVFGGSMIPHRMDKRLLPEGVSVAPDYNQCDPAAEDYIKNRPCYKGIVHYDIAKLVSEGAPMARTNGAGSYATMVRLCDYIPWDDRLLDMEFNSNYFGSCSVRAMANLMQTDDGWIIDYGGLSLIYATQYDSDYGFITESGIWVMAAVGDGLVVTTVDIPVIKALDAELADLSYSDLRNVPVGDIPGKRIKCPVHPNAMTVDKFDGTETQAVVGIFERVYPLYMDEDSILGAVLILDDGSELTVTEDMLIRYTAENQAWEINGLLYCSSTDVTTRNESGHAVFDVAEAGLYTSAMTGKRVTEIRLPGTVKQIDEKFIPDSIARVSDLPTSLPTSDEIDVLLTKLK